MKSIARGIVAGSVILIPRVGVPLFESLQPVYLRSTVQLSDCVIALRFHSMKVAISFSTAMTRRWGELVRLYRGTGARYITVARLQGWLATIRLK